MGQEFLLQEEKNWLWRQEFLQINPAGDLPVLLRSGKDAICGYYAIAEYLKETVTGRSGRNMATLFPGNADERAEVRRLVSWFAQKFSREVNKYLLEEKVDWGQGSNTSPDLNSMRVGRANMRQHLRYIENLMINNNWLAGNRISFADMMAAGYLSVLDYMGDVPWGEFDEAKNWYAKIKSRPSFRPLLADRVPGHAPLPAYTNLDF
jgi:glutathione S-transferase